MTCPQREHLILIGLLEDLGPDTPPSLRLGVAAFSAVLAILVLNMHVTRLNVPAVDIPNIKFDDASLFSP